MKSIQFLALLAVMCIPLCGSSKAQTRLNTIKIPGDGTEIKFATKDDIAAALLYVDTQFQNVYQGAVGYTDGKLDEFRDWTNGIWTAVASAASNTVEAILSPTPVEFVLDEEPVHSGAIMPNWTTSSLRISRGNLPSGEKGSGELIIHPSGPLRNYSVLIEEFPADAMENGVIVASFDPIAEESKLFATPAVYEITEEMSMGNPCQYGWLLTTNDVPCVITIREPEAGTVLIRRDKVAQQTGD